MSTHQRQRSNNSQQLLERQNSKKKKDDPHKSVWHKDIQYAIQSGRWENVRGNLQLRQATLLQSKDKKKNTSFWMTMQSRPEEEEQDEEPSFLSQDSHGRTPLHCALSCRSAPVDVINTLIQLDPRATQIANERGQLPIHFAVLYKHSVEVIGALIDTNPGTLSAVDRKGQSPLSYAVEIAMNETDLQIAPKSFWMPTNGDEELEGWQQEQSERWGIVHWLLLSYATYPQNLSVLQNSTQPILVDALLYAAPPSVIMLLIGASVMLLSVENKASAFAGSTLYSCIARHYPLPILETLTMQCPKDVRMVRDETGMGLVSAQFVSGCFTHDFSKQQWMINRQMLAALDRSVQEGTLIQDDPAFVEWWNKIEYLISFCGEIDDQDVKREYLLHSALSNPDIPPKVIRLLSALYPESIMLRNPGTNALPIHLASKNQDYIPRNYEFLLGGETTASGILLAAKPESVDYRHEKRLPLHLAIDAGKTLRSLEVFLLNDKDFCSLEKRCPQTGLYPFQLAATYVTVSTEDAYRWSCAARNKYSHTEWKGLSDRQKSKAILKAAEVESTERLSTIYELLRKKSSVVKPAIAKKETASSFRDAFGMGMASRHFILYYYTAKKGGGEKTIDPKKYRIFRKVIYHAREKGMLQNVSPAFTKWWKKMKFWILYCDPPRSNTMAKLVRKAVPRNDDEYLLHAALTNPDMPPQVIELLLALFPEAPQRSVLSSWLPLHIASLTTSYIPRPFEQAQHGAIELTLNAFPAAACCLADENLPIHLAIRSGRTWDEIQYLVEQYPRSLKICDPESNLYPFQMLCMRRCHSAEQQLQYQYKARNLYTESEWLNLTPKQHVREIRNVQKTHQLEILSSAFEVLRNDVSVIEDYNENYTEETSSRVDTFAINTKETNDVEYSDQEPESEESEEEYSESDESNTGLADTSYRSSSEHNITESVGPVKQESTDRRPFMSFLSRERKIAQQKRSVLECSASVFSSVDVMSLVSGTGHNNQRTRRGGRRVQRLDNDKPLTSTQNSAHQLFYDRGDDAEGSSTFFSEVISEHFSEEDNAGDFSKPSGNDGVLLLADLEDSDAESVYSM